MKNYKYEILMDEELIMVVAPDMCAAIEMARSVSKVRRATRMEPEGKQ